MVILTAFAIGVLSISTRSIVCYALAGSMIVAAFALAALVSEGAVSFGALVSALMAFNVGMAAIVFGAMLLPLRHKRSRSRF